MLDGSELVLSASRRRGGCWTASAPNPRASGRLPGGNNWVKTAADVKAGG